MGKKSAKGVGVPTPHPPIFLPDRRQGTVRRVEDLLSHTLSHALSTAASRDRGLCCGLCVRGHLRLKRLGPAKPVAVLCGLDHMAFLLCSSSLSGGQGRARKEKKHPQQCRLRSGRERPGSGQRHMPGSRTQEGRVSQWRGAGPHRQAGLLHPRHSPFGCSGPRVAWLFWSSCAS